jgi:hypothetical protein
MGNAGDRLREVAAKLDARAEEARGKSAEALDRVVLKLEEIATRLEAGEEIGDEVTEPELDEEPHVEHR